MADNTLLAGRALDPWARNQPPQVVNNLYPTDGGPNALEIQLANSLGPYQAPSAFVWSATERRSNDMMQAMLRQKLYEDQQAAAQAKAQAEAQDNAANRQNDLLKSLITSDPQTRAAVAGQLGLDPAYIENILRRENIATVADAAGAVKDFGAASADGYSASTDWISQNLGVPVQRTTPTSTVNAGIGAAASGASNPNKYDKVDYWTQDGQHITRNIPMGTELPPPASQQTNPGGATDSGQFMQKNRDAAFAQAQSQGYSDINPQSGQDMTQNGQRGVGFQRSNGQIVFVPVYE